MKKSRLLSLVLALVLVLPTSCSLNPETTDGDDASSSSSISSCVNWLAERLDADADGNTVSYGDGTVTLAVGEDAMGVDTTGLRNEGYVIRTVANDTVIVAKTDDGMDRGVRKYVTLTEKTGSNIVNYTEGLKIGKILLGGADLKNYKILLPKSDSADAPFAANATEAMGAAANELCDYTEAATGIKLPIEYVDGLHTMTDAQILEQCGNGIVLLADPTAKGSASIKNAVEIIDGEEVEVGPGEMGTESYILTVKDGIMRITGGNQRGCLYAVYDFLENYMGWRFLGAGDEYLYDADEIVIDDVNIEFSPTFGYRAVKLPAADGHNGGTANSPWHPELKNNCMNSAGHAHASYWGYGVGSTGWHAHSFADQLKDSDVEKGKSHYGDQPCFADEETKEVVIQSVLNMIEMRQGYPWYNRIGYELIQLGVSMNDNTNFCKCENCMAEIRKTSFTDLYLGFVNDVADVVAEKYPGVLINTAIYNVARKPPKKDADGNYITVPRDNVSIYYCVQGCNQHTLCAGVCDNYDTTLGYKNTIEKENLEVWANICDKVYVWYYAVSFQSNLGPCPNVYEIYDDVTYAASLGVLGFYSEGSSSVHNNFEDLKAYLFAKLMYNADITEEEFYALIDEYITLVYGEDSAPYIREYLDMHQASGDAIDGCFINNYHYPLDMMDDSYYRENYGTMRELFNMAEAYTRDAKSAERTRLLRLHMEFLGLTTTYDRDYVNGTDESRAEFEANYKWLVDNYRVAGFGEDGIGTTAPSNYELDTNPTYKFIPALAMLSKEGRA